MLEERARNPIVPFVVTGAILAVAQLHSCLAAVLPALPLLLLVLSLLSGNYPGCEAIVRLAERIAGKPKTARSADQPRPVPPSPRVATGGLLIALGLAKRPPPLAT
jgi:hypothetical protein